MASKAINPNARIAYELHLEGKDEFDIAEALNLPVDDVSTLLQEAQASAPSPTNTEARKDEIKRVDVWLQRVNADYLRSPDDARHMTTSQAVAAFIKLSERRCKLLGLDAPTRAEVEATLTHSPVSIDQELNQLAQELGFHDVA